MSGPEITITGAGEPILRVYRDPRTQQTKVDVGDGFWAFGVTKACVTYGIADPAAASWAGPIIAAGDEQGKSADFIARRVRTYGEQLSTAENKAAGISARLKVGRAFFDALTPKGREDVDLTALCIANLPLRLKSNAIQLFAIMHTGNARYMIPGDNTACAAAQELAGGTVPAEGVMNFPLDGCDKLVCRCGYMQWYPNRDLEEADARIEAHEDRIASAAALAQHRQERAQRLSDMRPFRTLDDPEPTPRGKSHGWAIWAALALIVAAIFLFSSGLLGSLPQ